MASSRSGVNAGTHLLDVLLLLPIWEQFPRAGDGIRTDDTPAGQQNGDLAPPNYVT